jgi:Co/Zn/Cd efflux system component
MLIIAVIGLVANLISMLFLHRDSNKNLNIKAKIPYYPYNPSGGI